jgi:hypothetical protein
MPVRSSARTIKTNVIQIFFGELDSYVAFCTGFWVSSRNVRKAILKRIPNNKQTIPGTMKAKRQLHNPVNDPAISRERTKHKLPNRQLKTRAVPILDVLETNHDIPTG